MRTDCVSSWHHSAPARNQEQDGREKKDTAAPQRAFHSLGIMWRETTGQARVPLDPGIGNMGLGGKDFQ